MNLIELQKMKDLHIISNTKGRPLEGLTNAKWQEEFQIRKTYVTPVSPKIKKMQTRFSTESGLWNEETQGTYYGTTNYQEYTSFINDVLRVIESGKHDYCYFIYQIMDILKFHYNDLKTKYCDGYWEIWLEQ